ncbi:MAG TPA: hypothetical protein VE242_04115, partial [Chthoniobacterales bacterium]|nr:hypothetical protein [Chthoniobacterales bacterium]
IGPVWVRFWVKGWQCRLILPAQGSALPPWLKRIPDRRDKRRMARTVPQAGASGYALCVVGLRLL